ncbi:MAG: carbamoyltransferase C-terminal domain-containing protein [Nitrospirota bacterium]
MYILGIVEGHNCSAALLKDGEIMAVCFEERLSRLKNDFGYPERAISYCLNEAGIGPEDIDHVAMVTENLPLAQVAIKREAQFTVADYIKEQEEYWKPVLMENRKVDYLSLFRDKIVLNGCYRFNGTDYERASFREFKKIRLETVKRKLRKRDDQVRIVNHHVAHSMYAVFTAPYCHEKDLLVLASDGYGDDCSASAGVFRNGKFEFVSKSVGSGIGRIYRYATLLLGMRPGVDEYKMMGLAPYAKEYHWRNVYEEMKAYLRVNGMEIEYTNPDRDIYFSLKERLKSARFDGIAAGVQQFCEEISGEWVKNCIASTGVASVVYSGGVSMNIKINKVLAEMDEVDDIFVGPSGGDESLSVGAAFALCHELYPGIKIKPLAHTYLGPAYDKDHVKKAIDAGVPGDFRVVSGPDDDLVAGLLLKGLVIARSCGRMEYGARALGNRSILADASDQRMIRKINDKIKRRDFWMPFAPIILKERMNDYVVNPKGLSSPYMTIGFDSAPLAKEHLRAAIHPADDSMRPQILEESHNPGLYSLIKKYEQKTGMGGVLNTSLNLHGEPICASPEDSIRTFLDSELDGLLMEGYLILRG